jgi:hypothetical protein
MAAVQRCGSFSVALSYAEAAAPAELAERLFLEVSFA